MAQLGANAHGEVLVPGRVPDCYLGLRLDPAAGAEPAGVLVVSPAALLGGYARRVHGTSGPCQRVIRLKSGLMFAAHAQTPLGYESFERHSAACSSVRNQPIYRDVGCLPTGSRPALFLTVPASPVSKA